MHSTSNISALIPSWMKISKTGRDFLSLIRVVSFLNVTISSNPGCWGEDLIEEINLLIPLAFAADWKLAVSKSRFIARIAHIGGIGEGMRPNNLNLWQKIRLGWCCSSVIIKICKIVVRISGRVNCVFTLRLFHI